MDNKRFVSIDIIKGIAMIMVILVHYQQNFEICKWFTFFRMGCPIFFVASGFGIMCLINKKYSGYLSKKNIGNFYFSRLKALAPGWYVAFIIIFAVNTITLFAFGSTLTFGSNRGAVSIIANLLFLQGLIPFCNNNVMPGGWYIGATAIFYALTPLILLAMRKFTNKRKLFFIVSSVFIIGIWFVLFYKSIGYFSFAVHYPEYLLGIMLYYDLSESMLKPSQIKMCLPIGLLSFVIAFVLDNSKLSFKTVLVAWITALATYLVLYYMISNESRKDEFSLPEKILSKFGENSYCIYLLHMFYAWTLIKLIGMIFTKFGLNIHTYVWFFVLIPIVLALSYFSGFV
ncbi:MAG: acyltransferase, partial [Clostridia bacterium]|nr:acyltransferase [Clostridia bacterium]